MSNGSSLRRCQLKRSKRNNETLRFTLKPNRLWDGYIGVETFTPFTVPRADRGLIIKMIITIQDIVARIYNTISL